MRHVHSVLIILAFFGANASAAVFQFTVPVATSKGDRAAYLWIPRVALIAQRSVCPPAREASAPNSRS